jgi:hypothetical protein
MTPRFAPCGISGYAAIRVPPSACRHPRAGIRV